MEVARAAVAAHSANKTQIPNSVSFLTVDIKSEHYLAVIAAFGHDGKQETVLLAMAPLLNK
ncbi:hypothetical protein GQ600_25879 [Phytophthora cactorum]|nr:hypothetical protein GQ600_25879 [Phytophthora cactorum]